MHQCLLVLKYFEQINDDDDDADAVLIYDGYYNSVSCKLLERGIADQIYCHLTANK